MLRVWADSFRCNNVVASTSILCHDKPKNQVGAMTTDPSVPPRSPVRPVEVDRTSPVPLYFQVATRLQELIEQGEIPVGSRLENEVELAERLRGAPPPPPRG